VQLAGSAVSHDEVAEYMRGLGSMVWTPKGMGRLVDQRRDAKTSRVELLTPDAAIEEFPVADIKLFFSSIELDNATLQNSASSITGEQPLVDFNITLAANYAI
jgi:type IV pilus assembly protein PilN